MIQMRCGVIIYMIQIEDVDETVKRILIRQMRREKRYY
jgi:hypothetical protein